MRTVESVPDDFVRSGEVVLVDPGTEELRRRIASGLVCSADQVGGALADYSGPPTLRPSANWAMLGWPKKSRSSARAFSCAEDWSPQPPQFVVAGVSGSARDEHVVRTAARLARESDAQLVVIHVNLDDALSTRRRQELDRDGNLTVELGASFDEVQGTAEAPTLADVVPPVARPGGRRPSPVSLGRASPLVGRVTPSPVARRRRTTSWRKPATRLRAEGLVPDGAVKVRVKAGRATLSARSADCTSERPLNGQCARLRASSASPTVSP